MNLSRKVCDVRQPDRWRNGRHSPLRPQGRELVPSGRDQQAGSLVCRPGAYARNRLAMPRLRCSL